MLRLLGIEAADRRPTAVAFATLVAMLIGHAMLETARDAMFLDKLPARYLTLTYLGIAALALIASKVNQRLVQRFSRRRLLSLSLLSGAVITAGFWLLVKDASPLMLGALYVWTGLLATVVVMQFWLLLSDILDVGRAKRLYSIIGAGGLVGATIGSLLAGLLTSHFGPRIVVLAAALAFLFAAALPTAFPSAEATSPQRRQLRAQPTTSGSSVSLLRHDRYLQRLLLMLLLGAVFVTGVDFLFKAQVASFAKDNGIPLGVFFARYYAVVNAIALLVQLLLAPRILKAVGVNRALLVTPALLLVAATGSIFNMGLVAALLMKGTDGALRHSLHRTASEILFLPLPRRTRDRFKGLAEALGQRGGQALASLAILAVTALTADPRIIAIGLVLLGIGWLVTLLGLQPLYLELFRQRLRDGMLDTDASAADLDLASFELLVSALSAEGDEEVTAALEMFDNYGKSALIPALILYHPSPAVVLRAFSVLDIRRPDVGRLSRRLLKHDNSQIRAAALKAINAHDIDEQMLRDALKDEDPAPQCTALALLTGADLLDREEAEAAFREMLQPRDADTLLALARSTNELDADVYGWVTESLIEAGDARVRAELARSFAERPVARQLPWLMRLLSDRDARIAARRALVTLGDEALDGLEAALFDTTLSRSERLHLPRSISQFGTERAVNILQRALQNLDDPRIEMKVTRGLVGMRATNPTLTIDQTQLEEESGRAITQALDTLHYRLSVEAILGEQPSAQQPASELLLMLLDDLHRNALHHAFRVQHIISPEARFDFMYDGLRSKDASRRASSRELLSHAATPRLRDSLVALTEDIEAQEKLARCQHFYSPPHHKSMMRACRKFRANGSDALVANKLGEVYMDVLRAMSAERSEALPSIVAHHLAEIDITSLRARVAEVAISKRDALRHAAERALALFEHQLERSGVR